MEGRLSELKEKQAELGDKISLLQKTNKKKDEEAAEIRQLIAECRDNLNRIKGLNPSTENTALKPMSAENPDDPGSAKNAEKRGTKDQGSKKSSQAKSSVGEKSKGDEGRTRSGDSKGSKGKAEAVENGPNKDVESCFDPDSGECKRNAKKGKSSDPQKGERVSCKVDLNKMKVRIRGPSEDLKKLDATQLINLLEKFQCQELVINTGEEMPQDPEEIRLLYRTHPGNLVVLAGLVLIAFLFNANLRSVASPFLLNLMFLSSFAIHYGMVFWMTFIRSCTLKFGLNYDTFHLVDNIILPKYYSLCVLLSALSLYSFLATHPKTSFASWPLVDLVQLLLLVVTFLMELITISYFIPALIKLRHATDDYVSEEEEPETLVPPSYDKNLSKLGKLNWTVLLVNLLTLVFLGANIYYVTNKIIRK